MNNDNKTDPVVQQVIYTTHKAKWMIYQRSIESPTHFEGTTATKAGRGHLI